MNDPCHVDRFVGEARDGVQSRQNELQAVFRLRTLIALGLSTLCMMTVVSNVLAQEGGTEPAGAEAADVGLETASQSSDPEALAPEAPHRAVVFLERQIALRTAALDDLRRQAARTEAELAQITAERAEADGAFRLLSDLVERLTGELTATQTAQAEAQAAQESMEALHRERQQRAESAEQELASAREQLAYLMPGWNEIQRDLTDARSALRIIEAALAVSGQQADQTDLDAEQRAQASALHEKAQQARNLVERLVAELSATHEQRAAEVSAATSTVQVAEQSAQQARTALEEVVEALAAKQVTLEALQARIQEGSRDLAEAQAAITVVEPVRESLAAEFERRQQSHAAVGAQVSALQGALDQSIQRREVFIERPPVADPLSIREVGVFQHDRVLMCVGFDPTGEFVFAGGQDNLLHRWREWDQQKWTFGGHASWPSRISFSEGGGMFSTGHEGALILWDGQTSEPVATSTIAAHEGFARSVAVSPDGRWIATAGNDRLARIWTATGELVAELAGHDSHLYNLAFHPSGGHLVTGDLKGVLKEWNTETWEFVRDLNADVLHKYDGGFLADCGGVRGICFSPDGTRLAVGGIGEVTNAFAGVGVPMGALFDWETGEQLAVMRPAENFQGSIWGMQYDPQGEFIVAAGGGHSGALWFWKPGEEKSFHVFPLPGVAYDLAMHPDGLRLAVSLHDGTVRVYELLADPLTEPAETPASAGDAE